MFLKISSKFVVIRSCGSYEPIVLIGGIEVKVFSKNLLILLYASVIVICVSSIRLRIIRLKVFVPLSFDGEVGNTEVQVVT